MALRIVRSAAGNGCASKERPVRDRVDPERQPGDHEGEDGGLPPAPPVDDEPDHERRHDPRQVLRRSDLVEDDEGEHECEPEVRIQHRERRTAPRLEAAERRDRRDRDDQDGRHDGDDGSTSGPATWNVSRSRS